ncbi:MAG: hypothetical protein U0169_01810 [Polyangiaceae bacterium]
MTFRRFVSFRTFAPLALASAALMAQAGCSSGGEAPVSESSDAIVDLPASKIRNQSIGNCWAYAVAGWTESLHKARTGQELNLSESYWTYWRFFESIVSNPGSNELQGGYGVDDTFALIRKYGYMSEGTFISEEIDDVTSSRQKDAEAALKTSLKEGALSTPEARKDRAIVRAEMEKAWKLSPAVADQLARVFGATYQWTFDNWGMDTAGTFIHSPKDLPVAWREYSRSSMREDTLAGVISRWSRYDYPKDPAKRRPFQKRIQRALHDKNPVLMDWNVAWSQYDNQYTFKDLPKGAVKRPAGHVSYFADYEISNVLGYGTLKAGKEETRPEALTNSLRDAAHIEFFRIKNSWGTDGNTAAPGFYDLHMSYLDGPLKGCDEKEDKTLDETKCDDYVPLTGVYLPYGY